MIPTDTTTPLRVVPPWRKDEAAPPAYFYRGASVLERASIEAELTGEHNARRVYGFELAAAVRGGILALLDEGADRDRLIELVDNEQAGVALEATERQLLLDAETVLQRHWPEYRDLVAVTARRKEIAPIVVFARLCTGWENVDAEFARGKDGRVAEAALAAIDPIEILAVGNAIYASLYDLGEKRDFLPQSPSADSPKPSPSAKASKVDGKSAKAKKAAGTPTPA